MRNDDPDHAQSPLSQIRPLEPQVPDSAFLQCVIPAGHGNSIDRLWRAVATVDGWK
jgi:hypothetical protein